MLTCVICGMGDRLTPPSSLRLASSGLIITELLWAYMHARTHTHIGQFMSRWRHWQSPKLGIFYFVSARLTSRAKFTAISPVTISDFIRWLCWLEINQNQNLPRHFMQSRQGKKEKELRSVTSEVKHAGDITDIGTIPLCVHLMHLVQKKKYE